MSTTRIEIIKNYTVKFWQGGRNARVYITKDFGGGKIQKCGYAALDMKDGKVASWTYESSSRANEIDLSTSPDFELLIDGLIMKAKCAFIDGYVIG